MEYETGSCVVFGLHGVCRLLGIEKEEQGDVQNYVLQPVGDPRSRLYVPVATEVANLRMKPILTEEEVQTLLDGASQEEDIWIANETKRKEVYHEIIRRGDRRELLRLIKTLLRQQKLLKQGGKRLHRVDEKFYKDAKKVLVGEFAHVLQRNPSEMETELLASLELE